MIRSCSVWRTLCVEVVFVVAVIAVAVAVVSAVDTTVGVANGAFMLLVWC